MNKKKVLKIIGIIILVLVVIFFIYAIRNFIIIRKLQKNFSKYENNQNYHISSLTEAGDNASIKIDYYKKDSKQVMFTEREINGETLKMTMYDNGERIDMFVDDGKEKTCHLDIDTVMMPMDLVNYLETESTWQTFLGSIFARISKNEYNQKKCYVINNFKSPLFLNDENKNEVYLEKNTGLVVKATFGDEAIDRNYEFDNVDDEVFVEPNIGEYKLLTDN